ncbi:MAG: methyltransferase domain-containing protein [Pseudomonadota bacterium]
MTRISAPAVAYAVDQFRDSGAELARLQQQATLIGAAEEEAFRGLGLPDAGRVLDLGCGPGAVAARIMSTRPKLGVVGFDRDPTVLARARAHIPVIRGDAESLPFPSGHFDGVYARLVLRHLPRPEAVMREMHRVSRRGGRVLILETDDDALILQPYPPAFGRALTARQQTFRRRGANPFLARLLPAMFQAAGFEAVAVRPLVVDSVSVGLAPFARIVLSPVTDAIDEDLLPRAEVDAARAAVEEWPATHGAFGMTTVLVAGGTKVD